MKRLLQKGFGITVVIVVLAAGALLGVVYWLYRAHYPGLIYGVCTQEGYVCRDGTLVGRIPPTCKIDLCSDGTAPLTREEQFQQRQGVTK